RGRGAWRRRARDTSGGRTGNARLVVTVGDKVHTTAEGEGKIEDARILDLPTEGPVTLKLTSLDGKPQFRTEMHTSLPGRNLLTPLLLALLPAQPPAEPPPPQGGLLSSLLSYPGEAA